MRQIPKNSHLLAALLLVLLQAGLASGTAQAAPKKRKPLGRPAPVVTATPTPAPPPVPVPAPESLKPKLETLLKAKSISKVVEDFDIVTNSEWSNEDFAFVNAVLVRTPLDYARPKIMDFSIYPKISPAIKKFDYNPQTQVIEMIGETHGLRMHSWVHVDQRYWDVIRYDIIRGDMTGFHVDAYLWNRDGKTIAVAKGNLPHAKQMLPTLVALIFKPVSEIVLSVATKNFRSYIEEEYQKQKSR